MVSDTYSDDLGAIDGSLRRLQPNAQTTDVGDSAPDVKDAGEDEPMDDESMGRHADGKRMGDLSDAYISGASVREA